MAAAMLCIVCQSMFLDCLYEDSDKCEPHHASFKSLRRSVEAGCYICQKLYDRSCKPRDDFVKSSFNLEELGSSAEQFKHCFDLEISWDRASSSSSDVIFFRLYETNMDIITHARNSLLHPTTRNEDALNLVRYWYRTCLEEHKCGRNDTEARQYPSRLLHLASSNVRLIDCSKQRRRYSYATMSHCWGNRAFFKLTSKTQRDLQRGIPLSDFPPSFQDVIIMARQLNIYYLWIDCYCILQPESNIDEDDEARRDWSFEALKMKDVYANGVLNFAIAHAHNPFEGAFSDRDTSKSQILTVHWRPSAAHSTGFYQIVLDDDILYRKKVFMRTSPLMQRAWVMQERLLAPRMIYFGKDEIFWECSTRPALSLSERIPQCYPRYFGTDLFFSSLTRNSGGINNTARPVSWGEIIEYYSSLALSYPTKDKLIALAGVAEEYAKFRKGDDYIAGLFSSDLLVQLCWKTTHIASRPNEWRAPSWSWASVDGKIVCKFSLLGSQKIASIEEVKVELLDSDKKYGALHSGSITIRGPILDVSTGRLNQTPNLYPNKIDVDFDYGEEKQNASGRVTLLTIVKDPLGIVHGLVLQQQAQGCYRRIGYWHRPGRTLSPYELGEIEVIKIV